MLALALTLQLLGAPRPAVAEGRLVPRLTLAAPGDAAAGAALLPPGAPGGAELPGPPRSQRAAAALGNLAGDAIAATAISTCLTVALIAGLAGAIDDSNETAAMGLLGACGATWLFLPPLTSVSAAITAGAPGDRRGRAYGYAFLARLAGMTAVTGLALLAAGERHPLLDRAAALGAVAALLTTELVLTPWVVVRTLNGAAPGALRAAPPPRAADLSRPIGDPALPGRL